MSGPLIILVGLIYAYVAFEQGWKGNLGMCVVYSGYAFSNAGFYYLVTR